jgi:type 1 glutamine amidotransferase
MDDLTVRITDADHPVTHGMTDFLTHDERYSYLEMSPDSTALAQHELEGRAHPLAWVRPHGPGRVAYDALGHSVRGYESPGHVELVRRSVRWLTRLGRE